MAKFILGFKNPEDEHLTQFEDEKQADFEAEEWVAIEADNLEQAKHMYEECFKQWQNTIG